MFSIARGRNFDKRCIEVFAESRQSLRAELGEIIASHAATGLLQSGATIRRSITAFEAHTANAVERLEQEFAALVQARGREWKRAMVSINSAIDGQVGAAKHLLERPFRIVQGAVGEPAPAARPSPAQLTTKFALLQIACERNIEHLAMVGRHP